MLTRFLLLLLAVLAAEADERREAYMRARKDGLWDADCERAFVRLLQGPRQAFLDVDVARAGRGVVLSMAGDLDFVRREVIPAASWLLSLRKSVAWPPRVKLALFSEKGLADDACLRLTFDVLVEAPPFEGSLAFRVKAFKIWAMARSPFQETIYLDFDSKPCSPTFFEVLWSRLGKKDDIALADNFKGQDSLTKEEDLKREHASGCVLLRSDSEKTRQLLSDYAFAHRALKKTRRGRRDQPALMVALRYQVLHNNLRLGTIPASDFCRKNTSNVVSCDTCVVAHKPARYDLGYKIFGIGFKKTGTTTLAAALKTLKIGPEPSHDDSVDATNALLKNDDLKPALRVAAHARAFADAPWCMAGTKLSFLQTLATTYPRAKFVLTIRDASQWWTSTRNWLVCLKPFNIRRYATMLGAKNFSKPAFMQAFDAYNTGVTDFFTSRKELHRLLVIDLAKERTFPWADLCAFVEAWGKCPSEKTNSLRKNAFLENEFSQSHPDAAPTPAQLKNCSSTLSDDIVVPTLLHNNKALTRLRDRRDRSHRQIMRRRPKTDE